jgi:hypothetical protein
VTVAMALAESVAVAVAESELLGRTSRKDTLHTAVVQAAASDPYNARQIPRDSQAEHSETPASNAEASVVAPEAARTETATRECRFQLLARSSSHAAGSCDHRIRQSVP